MAKKSKKQQRKGIPEEIVNRVLLRSGRRCPICYWLDDKREWIKGQIAHLDGDRANPALDNLCYMCVNHHEDYDRPTTQTKGFTPGEVKEMRDRLYDEMERRSARRDLNTEDTSETPTHAVEPQHEREDSMSVQREVVPSAQYISMPLYVRRFRMFEKIAGFLAQIVRDARIDRDGIMKFSIDTNEVLFLFGEDVVVLCDEIYRRAVRYRTLEQELEREPVGDRRSRLAQAESEELKWFSETLVDLKRRLKPYMNPV